MDNDLEATQEKADTWKPHAWSEEEIVAAVAHLKRRIPRNGRGWSTWSARPASFWILARRSANSPS